MRTLDILLEALELSVKHKGSVPLTTGHLLNILRACQKCEESREAELDAHLNGVLDKTFGDE